MAAKAAPVAPAPVPAQTGPIKLSPVVRRLIKEHGIDVSLLRGTGGGGRVTQKDVEDFLASKVRWSTHCGDDDNLTKSSGGTAAGLRYYEANRRIPADARPEVDCRPHGEVEADLAACHDF